MIGSHVARAFLSKTSTSTFDLENENECECLEIFGLKRPRSDLSSLAGYAHLIKFVVGDITDSVSMKLIIESVNPTHIFHYAAQAINSISVDMPYTTMDANVQGMINLMDAVKQNSGPKPKILYAGSSTEYGNTGNYFIKITYTLNIFNI